MKHLLQHFKTLTKHPQNAEELKNLILQMAIQGKLTEDWRKENINFESSTELINRIESSRNKLISEKKIKDYGTYEYIERGLQGYTIPKSWIWCKLANLTDLPYGKGLSKKELLDEGYDVFGANGIIGKYSSYLYEEKMLLISCRGAYSGKPNISPEKCYVTSNSLVCEFYLNNITLRNFFFHVIEAVPKEHIVSGSAQPQVTATNARELIVPLPPLEEQKAIVTIVNELFTEVEQLEEQTKTSIQLKEDFVTSALKRLSQADNVNQEWQLLQTHFTEFFTEKENVKQLRETILQLAVQGKLTSKWRSQNPNTVSASELLKRIQTEKQELIARKKIKKEKPLPPIEDHEKPYDLPEGWVWCRMQDLCPNISSGSTPPKPFFRETGIPYLKVYNIRDQKIDFGYKEQFVDEEYHSTKLKRSILNSGDVIMNIVGPPLGKVAIIPDDHPEWNCNQAISFFKPIDKSLNVWLYTFLLAGTFLKHIELIGTAGQDNISVTKSKMIMVPLPPLEEQKAIVKQVNSLMALCDSLEEHIENSQTQIEQLMQSCLKEVFEH